MKKNGFTLIELVMVIIILGILAAVAIPKFFDLQNQAKIAAEKGVVGNVRAAIHTYYGNAAAHGSAAWPTTLDGITGSADGVACTAAAPCFTTVLSQGVTSDWAKLEGQTYRGPTGDQYTYYPSSDPAVVAEFK